VTRRDRRELPQFVERIAKGLSSVAPGCELHRAQFGAQQIRVGDLGRPVPFEPERVHDVAGMREQHLACRGDVGREPPAHGQVVISIARDRGILNTLNA